MYRLLIDHAIMSVIGFRLTAAAVSTTEAEAGANPGHVGED